MIKLEMHCHVMPSSHCAKADAEIIIKRYKEAGFNGICITNHFAKKHFVNYNGNTDKEKIDYYFSIFDNFKKLAEENGFKVFLGAEVSCATLEEYILFGFDRELLYDNKLLFEMDQKELFAFAEKHGLFMYQPHPFRDRVKVLGDPNYLHGAELFNGHYHHINSNEKAQEFCEKNNLVGLVGNDFHDPEQPMFCCTYVPDDVVDEKALVKCLFNRDFTVECDRENYIIALEKHLKKKQEKEQCK